MSAFVLVRLPYTSGLDDTALRGQLQATGAGVTASALWLPAPGADAGASGYQAKCLEVLRLREERLTVRKLGGRKGTRVPMTIPQDHNLCWSLESGRRFRIPSLVDDFTRECLGRAVETSLTGWRRRNRSDRRTAHGRRVSQRTPVR
jgi:hypothetical protein